MNTRTIDEGLFIDVNGMDQWVAIRGKDARNPVMLIVSGPGVATSLVAPFYAGWEQYFTLIHWDQPGAGATHSVNPQARDSLGLDTLVQDGVAVAGIIRERLEVERLIVLGISGGSIVGLKMMQARPDYFSAYVGTGQFVNWAEQDALSYRLLLEKARQEGNEEAERELTRIGPPPYADSTVDQVKSLYASALTEAEYREFGVYAGLMRTAMSNPPPANFLASGVRLEDPRMLSLSVYDAIRTELLAFDARAMSPVFDMPVFFIQGDSDLYSVTASVQDYEREISAPIKETIVIEGAGHSVAWMRAQFLAALRLHVLPAVLN